MFDSEFIGMCVEWHLHIQMDLYRRINPIIFYMILHFVVPSNRQICVDFALPSCCVTFRKINFTFCSVPLDDLVARNISVRNIEVAPLLSASESLHGYLSVFLAVKGKGKGKVFPLQA